LSDLAYLARVQVISHTQPLVSPGIPS